MKMETTQSAGSAKQVGKATVKVYSTTTCPWCVKVKDFLKEHKIAYDDINISTDEKARAEMFDKSGQFGVPVTEVGDQIIIGFNREALKKALKI